MWVREICRQLQGRVLDKQVPVLRMGDIYTTILFCRGNISPELQCDTN